jgi:energy-coupling factor transport system ATP-binding protein
VSITFEGVSYSYHPPAKKTAQTAAAKPAWGNAPDSVWALKDINFTLEEGEFFGIAGHTGSGKSTLIQHMNGLLQPHSGRVLVDGRDISDKKTATRARAGVGLVFQYPEHQLFAATVYDDVAFGPRNLGLGSEEVDACVREALASVALDFDTVHEKNPFELSGGQQRRVAFAGVLAMKPTTLILDEPVAGLDPAARTDFLNLIKNLHASGLTVVFVSHSMNNLARLCDRILVLKEGEQFMLGTPEEVFAQEASLKAIGLGVPSAQRMANSLRQAGVALPESFYDTARLTHELAALYQGHHGSQDSQDSRDSHDSHDHQST